MDARCLAAPTLVIANQLHVHAAKRMTTVLATANVDVMEDAPGLSLFDPRSCETIVWFLNDDNAG